jgi:hypothetical protein
MAAPIAAKPATAAVIARLHVYEAHRIHGPSKSPSIDAPPTIMAARGPKTTAAKTVGSSEIDACVVAFKRTLARSATAATAARARTPHAPGTPYPFPKRAATTARVAKPNDVT